MEETNIEKQLRLFKEYCVVNKYTIENDIISINGSLYLMSLPTCDKDFLKGCTINDSLYLSSLTTCDKDFLKGCTIDGSLYLRSLTICDKDFLKGCTINGSLYLSSLKTCDKDFLKGCTINGSLDLRSLTECDKDFLKGCTINGYLDLSSLTTCVKDFLKGCTINGSLYLRSLTECDEEILRSNIKKIEVGYNEERNNCYFDGILSKVTKVSKKKDYTIYETPFKDFIIQKGDFTAHTKTIKKGILDVEFKIVADKIKNEPINEDTIITVKFYRMLTGACDFGCRQFMSRNNLPYKVINEGTKDEETVELEPMNAKDFIKYLEKDTNNFGYEKFKSLITF